MTSKKAKKKIKRFRLELPTDIDDSYAMADWLEMRMFVAGMNQISRAELSDMLVAEISSTPQELENPIGFIFTEIGRRRLVAGEKYPFVLDGNVITLDPGASLGFYRFLLMISLEKSPLRAARRHKEVDLLFDKVVTEAVKGYLGSGTDVMRFGWPPTDGRPTTFPKALKWASGLTNIPLGNNTGAASTKDGGVDLIAWKPFADERLAFTTMLVQCTIQRDWTIKADDVDSDVWRGRLDTGRDALSALAIPFVIPKNFDKWDDLRRKVSVIFDRLRLTQMLKNTDFSRFDSVSKWTEKETKKFTV